MNNYYFLSWKTPQAVASAFAPKGKSLPYNLIPQLEGVDELPFEFELVKLTEAKNGLIQSNDLLSLSTIWLDYQPNSLAWPLMSAKLRTIVENNLTGMEGVNWIRAKVNGLDEERVYYILRFTKMLDVLDEQKTMYVQSTGFIIKPCFSLEKIRCLAIFHIPSDGQLWKISSGLYVSEVLKKAIEKEKITGIGFEK